jgi:molybdopterin/thiamine biosynthesis adenylyltransferase
MAKTDRRIEKLRTFVHLGALLGAEFSAAMRKRRLRIAVGDSVLESEAGQALVLTVGRLSPRICERIDFHVPNATCIRRLRPLLADDVFSGESLAALAGLIWNDGDFTASGTDPVNATIGIGAPGDVTVGIGSDGAAVVGHGDAVAIVQPDALEAALVAAALACAEATKYLWPEIFGPPAGAEIRFAGGPLGGDLEPLRPVMLQRPVVAGVGAVGCAAIYTLMVLGATGRILLLDPDFVSDSNLMRYVLFDSRHLKTTKPQAAKELIAAAGLDLKVECDRNVLQEYLKEHPDEREHLELVVSAVDTYEARREIAGELPRQIVNAGTSPGDFTVSRHGFGDGYACLACLYPPREVDVEMTAVMARELGLEKAAVEQLRRTKEPMTADLLARLAENRGHGRDQYVDFVGEPLDTVYHKVVCSERPIETERGEAVAPLAYGSALAGFLLGRVVAEPAGDYRRFRVDFIRGLRTPMRTNPRQRESCPYCSNEIARNVYNTRWGHEAT